MIKFFRHIRKSLLEENKMGKYFKYAIGEIILVVIGILIALQINNWNEHRKLEEFEKNILIEIDRTIVKDLADFKYFEKRIIRKDTAIDNMLFARKGEKRFSDKQLIENIIWVHNTIIYSYNKGPYETLKSSGLDKIKSDSLRYNLTYYYEVILPRFTAFFDNVHKEYQPKINKHLEELEKEGFYKKNFELSLKREGFYPKTHYNVKKYLTEEHYYDVLLLEANYKYDLWSTIIPLIKHTEKIKEDIGIEIEKRFKKD